MPGNESIPTGSTNSYDEQTSSSMMADMNLGGGGGVWTNHPTDGYGAIDNNNHHSRNNNMAPSFEDFGMIDPGLAGRGDNSGVGAQPHVNMTDPWGNSDVPQMQSGYDWVSEPVPQFVSPVSRSFRYRYEFFSPSFTNPLFPRTYLTP